MTNRFKSRFRLMGVIVFGVSNAIIACLTQDQDRSKAVQATTPVFTVDGQIALHALMSLSDAHLQKLADDLTILTSTEEALSGNWQHISEPFAKVAQMNLPAVYWFAKTDGTYWTLDQGLASSKLTDRAYFPRLMAGQTVIGDLVVSHSTNRNTAIVAVPIQGSNNKVIGALGCSVHLDSLCDLLRKQMGGLEGRLLFFAIDAKPLGALNSDPSLIFTEPMKLGDKGMQDAFKEILSKQEGVVNYNFRGGQRTVLYRKSKVTGWWYGFGIIR